jgi:hypothetical protein
VVFEPGPDSFDGLKCGRPTSGRDDVQTGKFGEKNGHFESFAGLCLYAVAAVSDRVQVVAGGIVV